MMIGTHEPTTLMERTARAGIFGLRAAAVGWLIILGSGASPVLAITMLLAWGHWTRVDYLTRFAAAATIGIRVIAVVGMIAFVSPLVYGPSMVLLLLAWALESRDHQAALLAAFLSVVAGSAFLGIGVWLTELPWLGEGSAVKYFFAAVIWLLGLPLAGAGGGTLWSRLVHRESKRRAYA